MKKSMKKLIMLVFAILTAVIIMTWGFNASNITAFADTGLSSQTNTVASSSEYTLTTVNGKIYCYKNGKMLVNKLVVLSASDIYYFGKQGAALTSCWKVIKGNKYYFQADGKACLGSCKIGKSYYIFKENGKLAVAKKKHIVVYAGDKYYASKAGKAISGWNFHNYKVIYAAEDGKLAVNKYVSYIKFGPDGYAVRKWQATAKIYARKFIDAHTEPGWSSEKKLYECFFYLLEHRQYIAHYIKDKDAFTSKPWEYKAATEILSSDDLEGNCRSFASAIAAIAKELGYQPYVVNMWNHSGVRIGNKYYDSNRKDALFNDFYGARGEKYPNVIEFKF